MSSKALIAMSGGVDSSVAAHLMKEAGFDCVGVTMKLGRGKALMGIALDPENPCVSEKDILDAKSVCSRIGIPHYVYDFSDRFREEVIDYFVSSYEKGITPNPCIECNRHLKFESLFTSADELGCELIVTGHYASVVYDEASSRYLLKKAVDHSKDQSYFLYKLTQAQLSRVRFPLGSMPKTETRAIASSIGLSTAKKRDSQDICFVKDGDYAGFIESYTKKTYPKGNFVSSTGEKLGEHRGIIRYTVGQRKGLGISLSKPAYVVSVDSESNTVVLGDNSELFSTTFYVKRINLISVDSISKGSRMKVRVRYRHEEQWATVLDALPDRLLISFDEPQRAITPGQSAVFYDGDTVIGGGEIESVVS